MSGWPARTFWPTSTKRSITLPGTRNPRLLWTRAEMTPVNARSDAPTGLTMALPPGVEGQIRPRSGLALRHGITVLNSPGTVDSDYRGEVQVILANFGQASFSVERGARIAQLVLAATLQAAICEVANLDETTRGVGGFGSTGMGEGKANRVDREP